jgi:uncharacterized membrane protein YoaT (DUF817 family)
MGSSASGTGYATRLNAPIQIAHIRLAVEAIPHRRIGEFLLFGFKQGWARLFGGLPLGTRLFWPEYAPTSRQDALVLPALRIQIAMLTFYIVGAVMELFKTSVDS